MTVFKQGTIARVPFPYTDLPTLQYRPGLIVATGLGPKRDKLWVVMVTSAANPRWPGDVAIEQDHAAAGLPSPSLIRTEKVTTIDESLAEWRGEIDAARLAEVREKLGRHLGMMES
jgi:mRNA interferase MazF